MVKYVILEFEKGLDEKYKKYTREAVQHFFSLFPKYKDKFVIREEKPWTKERILETIKNSIEANPSISPDDIWEKFEKQSDGTYLAKNMSIDWCIREASVNGKVDLIKWQEEKNAGRQYIRPIDPFQVSISKRPTTFAYGIGGGFGPCVSAAMCGDDEQFFKSIVIHEMGHLFNATHENRRNVVENLGAHCTDKTCLMYEYAYTPEAQKNLRFNKGENPFCDDCMKEMEEHMQKILKSSEKKQEAQKDISSTPKEVKKEAAAAPKIEKTKEKNIEDIPEAIVISSSPIEEEEIQQIKDPAFKKPLRKHFEAVAKKEKSDYVENEKTTKYQAQIVKKDGSVLNLEAMGEKDLSMSAIDKEGKVTVPDYEYFKEVVAYVQSQKSGVSFGKIKSPEYNARLLLACMEADPPVKIRGQPEITKEFLEQVSPETKERLKEAMGQKKEAKKVIKVKEALPRANPKTMTR